MSGAGRRPGRRIALRRGLCRDQCGSPALDGETRCAACKEVARLKDRERYDAAKAAGRCVKLCGREATCGVLCGVCHRRYAKIRAAERAERAEVFS